MAKNIVLLSDGTGNAASSRTPTNVWRLYQALDLSDPTKQVAFYDDGVGTQRWKPLKALGGAFGFGLKRNVLEMYKFLSRTYQPGRNGEPGDRIFVFGFSRGAYTVRVLVGLVHCCGLARNALNPADLDDQATRCYRAFRGKFKRGHRKLWTWLKNGGHPPKATPTEPADRNLKIAFVGVWDTVDAYGLPIDEMASAWDYFIYPYRFTDRLLSSMVEKASHAMALDDERHTFHPVLWNEDDRKAPDGGPRINQVWFAGMHANVGGGYPDDTLAHVPLAWMLSELDKVDGAAGKGLELLPGAREALEGQADVDGRLYNSRSGVQAYYRYKPRNVEELCHDKASGVDAKPRIHASVLQRIGNPALAYAPLGVPQDYDTVSTPPRAPAATGGGADAAATTPAVPEETNGPARMAEMAKVWDWVHCRRWLYVTLILITFAIVLSPVVWPGDEGGTCGDGSIWCSADSVLQFVSPLLPDWSLPWQRSLGQHPWAFWPLVALFIVLAVLSGSLRHRIEARATAAWRLAFTAAPAGPAAAVGKTWTQSLRDLCPGPCAATRNAGLALIALALMLFAGVVVANKVLVGGYAALGYACGEPPEVPGVTAEGHPTATLHVDTPCLATGIRLVAGQRYRIIVEAKPAEDGKRACPEEEGYPWCDGGIQAGPEGFSPAAFTDAAAGSKFKTWWRKVVMRLMVVWRREWSSDWFVLMGQIGANSLKPFEISDGIRWFRAPATGDLFVYVNDAVFGIPCAWAAPYSWKDGANWGVAKITVVPVGGARTK